MKKNKLLVALVCVFVLLVGATTFVSFSSNIDEQEVIVKSITPIYDSNSGVIVNQNNVTFNDKNQTVDYKVVIENTQDYNIKVNDIKLSSPTEKFLKYEVKHGNDIVIDSNATKEIIVSFETMGIEGWGRNFSDELTANISFEKVVKQEEPPVEEEQPKEEENSNKEQPSEIETPEEDKEERPNEEEQPSEDDKEERPNEEEQPSEDDKEENKVPTVDSDNKEENNNNNNPVIPNNNSSNKIEDNTNDDLKEYMDKKFSDLNVKLDNVFKEKENGNNQIILIISGIIIGFTSTMCVILIKNKNSIKQQTKKVSKKEPEKKKKTGILLIVLCTSLFTFSITSAEKVIELTINFSVNFESQNIMQKARAFSSTNGTEIYTDYWLYSSKIKNIYIKNEKEKITSYIQKFDISRDDNNRIEAYLKANESDSSFYDLYIQADGIIYLNEDSSYLFSNATCLEQIYNIEALDTSNVKNMSYMFYRTRLNNITLDLSSFDTSNVTNMSYMFSSIKGYNFNLILSNLNTSKVTNMSYMFYDASRTNKINTSITISNTSDNFNYSNMFENFGMSGTKITLHYTEKNETIVDKIIASNSLLEKGNKIVDVDKITNGSEIHLYSEKFTVIGQTEDTVKMLARYNIGTDYRQSTQANYVTFADKNGWEYAPGPKEIDIQEWTSNPKTYVNNYVSFLQNQLNDKTISGDLISLEELSNLKCTIPKDYSWISSAESRNCGKASYKLRLTNGYLWWTKSARSDAQSAIWRVKEDGSLYYSNYNSTAGVRPVVTISKETLRNLNS